MVKNILKVDPVAFRYEDPDFIEGPGVFGENDDFEWSDDDIAGDEFESGKVDDPSMDHDSDSDSLWEDDALTEDDS